jgi:hypothetical protein
MFLPKTIDAVLTLLGRYYIMATSLGTVGADLGTVGRGNRGAAGIGILRAPLGTLDAESAQAILNASLQFYEEPDRHTTLQEVIKSLMNLQAEKQGNNADVTIIDQLVDILRLPCPANRLTLPSIEALQELLLRPDEVNKAKFLEVTKGNRCFHCGHEFRDRDTVIYHTPAWNGDAGSIMVCGGCEHPAMVKCANRECQVRVAVKKAGEPSYCEQHAPATKSVRARAPKETGWAVHQVQDVAFAPPPLEWFTEPE